MGCKAAALQIDVWQKLREIEEAEEKQMASMVTWSILRVLSREPVRFPYLAFFATSPSRAFARRIRGTEGPYK